MAKTMTYMMFLGAGALILYVAAGETLHFFNHFLPALAVGFFILALLSFFGRDVCRLEFALPALVYLYAVIPEFLMFGKKAAMAGEEHHEVWENIFLLHTWLDHQLEETAFVLLATGVLAVSAVGLYWYRAYTDIAPKNTGVE